MKKSEIYSLLMNTIPLQEVYISGDSNHFKIIAIGEIFNNISPIKKQQIIYKPLMKYIADNSIHALSINTYTPQEWKLNKRINNSK